MRETLLHSEVSAFDPYALCEGIFYSFRRIRVGVSAPQLLFSMFHVSTRAESLEKWNTIYAI